MRLAGFFSDLLRYRASPGDRAMIDDPRAFTDIMGKDHPRISTRKLISSSFHRLDMTLAVAEALHPNNPKPSPNAELRISL